MPLVACGWMLVAQIGQFGSLKEACSFGWAIGSVARLSICSNVAQIQADLDRALEGFAVWALVDYEGVLDEETGWIVGGGHDLPGEFQFVGAGPVLLRVAGGHVDLGVAEGDLAVDVIELGGAEVARWAHNPEVGGSKPLGAIKSSF